MSVRKPFRRTFRSGGLGARLVVVAALALAFMVVGAPPAGAGSQVTNIAGTDPLLRASCPTATLCVVTDQAPVGKVFTTTDPAGGAAAWTAVHVDGSNLLLGVSCPTSTFCVAGDAAGNVVTTTNPTGGAAAWTVSHVDGGNALIGISCPSTTLCVAGDSAGNVLTSTNPTGGAGAWTVTPADAGNTIYGVSCPSTTLCVVSDAGGNVLTSTNPTGGAGAWTTTNLVFKQSMFDVACRSTTLCVVSAQAGRIFSSTNPTGGAAAWKLVSVDGGRDLAGVSCPSTSLCLVTDGAGNVLTATNPTGDAAAWTTTNVDGTNALKGVACASSALCVVPDDAGNVVIWSASVPGLLRVVTSPAVPSQLTVDGAITDTYGLTWVKEPAGSHTVCFKAVPGFTTPGCQTVSVSDGATTTVTGSFVERGYLHVTTSPAVASQISVDGVPRNDWGLFTDLPVGSHQVCFGKVAGFTPPACQTVSVTAGATTDATGTFTASAGTALTGVGLLRVTTSPAVPSQITVDGNIADTWGLTWLEIPGGSHTVCFGHVQGFGEPGCQTVSVTNGATTTVNGTFSPRGYLRVVTSPAVAGTITVNGVPADDWGVFTDVPVGAYTVCFGSVAGKTAPACQTPSVTAGATTTVTGTYT